MKIKILKIYFFKIILILLDNWLNAINVTLCIPYLQSRLTFYTNRTRKAYIFTGKGSRNLGDTEIANYIIADGKAAVSIFSNKNNGFCLM